MTNELLELIPDHERARGNKIYYEKELQTQESKQKLRGDDGTDQVPVAKVEMMVRFFNLLDLFNNFDKISFKNMQLPYNKPDPSTYNANERKLYEMGNYLY